MVLKNVKKETWIRTTVLVVALVNQGLQITGKQILPYTPEEVANGVSFGLTIVATIWAWWKNNSFSENAQYADEIMKGGK
ncbi:phage holin [Alkalibaculum sp. M08DMB]|uniref:Phage holin n=1 Tax=Alkalibaculum sporogenes TaxID=2655001 RepID=A0A6A7KBK7_9FIRM|nr:phage holin [Alkalibaculum sporogenes]MPW26393.1 phage holin [Alkalibaculum sporogenes]